MGGWLLRDLAEGVEYRGATLDGPIHGCGTYAAYCGGFFAAFTECEFRMREPVIHEGDCVILADLIEGGGR